MGEKSKSVFFSLRNVEAKRSVARKGASARARASDALSGGSDERDAPTEGRERGGVVARDRARHARGVGD